MHLLVDQDGLRTPSASTPRITTASARRSASTRPGEASGLVRRRAGLMLHRQEIDRVYTSTRRRTTARAGRFQLRSTSTLTARGSRMAAGPARVGRGCASPRVYVEGPSEVVQPHACTWRAPHRRHHTEAELIEVASVFAEVPPAAPAAPPPAFSFGLTNLFFRPTYCRGS